MPARTRLIALLLSIAAPTAALGQGVTRSWNLLPTGNGHGFQVFDRQQNRVVDFLDHPYRYLASGDDGRTFGIGRRDLAHDIYFGVRAQGGSTWINKCGNADCTDLTSVEYERESHIIHGATTYQGLALDTYAFAPIGYPGNGLLMLIRATNNGGAAIDASFFLKPNLLLGSGRVDPSSDGESLSWSDTQPAHAEETGPGGGHALYVPIGAATHVSCGGDTPMYNAVLGGGAIGDTHTCNGSNQVFVLQSDARVEAGASVWWGVAILFVDDNPSDPRAALFKDPRSVGDVLGQWATFAGSKTAGTIHDEALAELEAWRASTMPAQLDATEQRLWRQSETVLRLGQVMEYDRKNRGMMLAALPPGEWHTGWLRDGTYAIVALAMTGHYAEAKAALDFNLGAEGGFFSAANYLNRRYRLSVCRYFGNGIEEADFNQDGPNIETDGWGLVLWAAHLYLQYSCDLGWLDAQTWRGDTVFEALHQIAQDIEATATSDLPGPDASIWEVHWNRRQVFAYTAAAHIRGLFGFAEIARAKGRTDLADQYRGLAQRMLDRSKTALVHAPTQSFASHLGVAGQEVHVDGSTIGFHDWLLIAPDDARYVGTLQQFSKLVTGFGGYRRLEPQLSLTGQGGANTYDLSEWILLDLRIADAWRRAGYALSNDAYVGRAEELVNKVTRHAAANDFLVPELFDPNNGRYTGVVPMVGYGAGAWMMSQLERFGANAPGPSDDFARCSDPCFNNPCQESHKGVCTASGATFTCSCDPGYEDQAGTCVAEQSCSATTCAGHGTCSDESGAPVCTCEQAYGGDHCESCAQGYREDGGACVPVGGNQPGGGQPVVFNDGPATLCAAAPGRGAATLWIPLSIVVVSLFIRRYRRRRDG
ncbi:MAG: hypothetical protein IT384_11545 [Deltaproteobacteria bacterium]|nr:hypothetical protein [Deltaproteobacteria bacterium]